MAFSHMLPSPEALQLSIYVGYLKRKVWGGILAGLTFILAGAVVMIVLSWLYVKYGKLPQVMDALYVLKPDVLGIIAAGIIKLGRAAIPNFFLAVLLVGAFSGMRFVGYVASGIPGAVLATFFVFLPSFIFVIAGMHYIEKVRENRAVQAFLAGVSAAVVGVIAVVSLDLIPEALVNWPTVGIAVISFLLIALLKRDVAFVAIGAMLGGIIYSSIRGLA